jgi:two-component system response regulator AtoC
MRLSVPFVENPVHNGGSKGGTRRNARRLVGDELAGITPIEAIDVGMGFKPDVVADQSKQDRFVDRDTGTTNIDAAVEHARDGVDLVLLDYKLPDMDGVAVLRRIRELDPDALVILLTAYASVETAVEAMKKGAFHFANKPFNLDDVAFLVSRALETTQLRREVRRLRASQAQPYSVDWIVGHSTTMEMLRNLLSKVATSPASTVMLTGESGTGKDLAAKVLHYNSDRANKPFMNLLRVD